LQASLEALIKEQPADPYAYLGRHFCSGYRPNDWRTGVAPVAADPTGNVDIKPPAEDPTSNHKLGAPGTQPTQHASEARSGDAEILSLSLNLRPGNTIPDKGTTMVNANNVQRPELQTLKPQDLPGKPQDHVPTGEKGPASAKASKQSAPAQPAPAQPAPRTLPQPTPVQPLKEASPPPKQKPPSSPRAPLKEGKKDCLCCTEAKPIPTAEEEEAALVIQRSMRSKGRLETRGERTWPEEAPTGPKCLCCPDEHHEARSVEREPFGAPAPPGLEGKDVPRPLISPRATAPRAPAFG